MSYLDTFKIYCIKKKDRINFDKKIPSSLIKQFIGEDFYNQAKKIVDNFPYESELVFEFHVYYNRIGPERYAEIQKDNDEYCMSTFDSNYYYQITIQRVVDIITHYPEVKLKNSKNQYHLIKDLFTKIKFTFTDVVHIDFQGMRTSYSETEYQYHYRHSHLHHGEGMVSKMMFTRFCLGSSEVSFAIEFLKNNIINKESIEDSLYLLMNLITAFVKWESLEGGPYIKIETLKANDSLPGSVYEMLMFAHRIVHLPSLKYYFDLQTNRYYIADIEELNEELKLSLELIKERRNENFYGIIQNGRFTPLSEMKVSTPDKKINDRVFNFKDREFPLIIKGNDEGDTIDEDLIIINPQILEYVKKRIEQNQDDLAKKHEFRSRKYFDEKYIEEHGCEEETTIHEFAQQSENPPF